PRRSSPRSSSRSRAAPSPGPPGRASRPSSASRGSARRRAGRRRSESRPRLRAPSDRRGDRTGPRARSSSADRRPRFDDISGHVARDDLPPHVQRARQPRTDAARARRRLARRRPRARHRRRLARRNRRARRPSRLRARIRRRPPPRGEAGTRPGLRRALAGDTELLLEMDCDFSHDPADVPRLIAAVEGGADIALGSRYVPGGGIPDWGLVRRGVSGGGNLYARVILASRVHDLTGGFKCFRRRVLETIDLDAVRSKGYAFQIETTYRAVRAGFRVVEVPITFVDRKRGGSKMSRAIVLEAVWKVPLLRLQALTGRL